jgi:hypothetical protein
MTIYTITIVNKTCGWVGKIETYSNKEEAEERFSWLEKRWDKNGPGYRLEMHTTQIK